MKMYTLVQKPGSRPLFELEPSDHPLSEEYYGGITPERVKDITVGEFGKYSKRSN